MDHPTTPSDEAGKPQKKLTIYDLATLAGASPSAVSAVINGTWKKRRISVATADRIRRIADEQGFAPNRQASSLRRDRSHIIGMIVPKYDNRYFGAVAERFEELARARGLFPVITCTQRDPELEFEATREMVAYQTECIVACGATDPDRISRYCATAGVQSINLDLPGTVAPSVLSDNFGGARDLARLLGRRTRVAFGHETPLVFIGGRPNDHNTAERLRGFLAAEAEAGLVVPDAYQMMPGYSAAKVEAALEAAALPNHVGLFVNSTISLEGVIRWMERRRRARSAFRFASFDWDPFAALMPENVGMVRQDVDEMLRRVFHWIESPPQRPLRSETPCIFRMSQSKAD